MKFKHLIPVIIVSMILGVIMIAPFTDNFLIAVLLILGIYGGIFFIQYAGYKLWIIPIKKIKEQKGYWMSKLFFFYMVNGVLVIYSSINTEYYKPGFIILFIAGIIVFLLEFITYAKTGRSILDTFKHSSKELQEKTGHSYALQGFGVLILAFAFVFLAYYDVMLLLEGLLSIPSMLFG